jgi:hypothetical protein
VTYIISNRSQRREEAMSSNALREELVGHCTLAVLGLLGLGFYSATYAVLYTLSPSSKQTRMVPAVLEMWMAYTHLASAGACCALHLVLATVMRATRPVPHLSEAQSALFLGVALTVTLFGTTCIGGGQGECALYFGAAALPRIAAVGAVTWAWLMYLGSLACQTTLGRMEPLTSATVVAWVPWLMARTAVSVCGDPWRMQVCASVSVRLVANATQSMIQADCGVLDIGLWVLGLGVTLGAAGAWMPYAGLRLGGAALAGVAIVTAWSLQPTDAPRVAPSGAYYGTLLGLTLVGALHDLWHALGARRNKRPKKTSGQRPPAPTTARYLPMSMGAPDSAARLFLSGGPAAASLVSTTTRKSQ